MYTHQGLLCLIQFDNLPTVWAEWVPEHRILTDPLLVNSVTNALDAARSAIDDDVPNNRTFHVARTNKVRVLGQDNQFREFSDPYERYSDKIAAPEGKIVELLRLRSSISQNEFKSASHMAFDFPVPLKYVLINDWDAVVEQQHLIPFGEGYKTVGNLMEGYYSYIEGLLQRNLLEDDSAAEDTKEEVGKGKEQSHVNSKKSLKSKKTSESKRPGKHKSGKKAHSSRTEGSQNDPASRDPPPPVTHSSKLSRIELLQTKEILQTLVNLFTSYIPGCFYAFEHPYYQLFLRDQLESHTDSPLKDRRAKTQSRISPEHGSPNQDDAPKDDNSEVLESLQSSGVPFVQSQNDFTHIFDSRKLAAVYFLRFLLVFHHFLHLTPHSQAIHCRECITRSPEAAFGRLESTRVQRKRSASTKEWNDADSIKGTSQLDGPSVLDFASGEIVESFLQRFELDEISLLQKHVNAFLEWVNSVRYTFVPRDIYCATSKSYRNAFDQAMNGVRKAKSTAPSSFVTTEEMKKFFQGMSWRDVVVTEGIKIATGAKESKRPRKG